MKKIPALFTIIALLLTAKTSFAQPSVSGSFFKFSNGMKEWSEPLTTHVFSKWMEKKKQHGVDLSIRLKFTKKLVWACHFEAEITNTSTEYGIQFEVNNGQGKDKLKLKPGETETVHMVYAPMKPHVKSEEDCMNCAMSLYFNEIEGYKQ